MDVITTYCESTPPTSLSTRYQDCARRFGVTGLDSASARARIRAQMPDADPEDFCSSRTFWASQPAAEPAASNRTRADADSRR